MQSLNHEPEPVKPVPDSPMPDADLTAPTPECETSEMLSTDFISEMGERSPNVISIPSPPHSHSAALAMLSSFTAASIELTSSPTPTVVSSIRASFSRTPSPTYSNPTSGVSSTSYQLDQFDRPSSNQDNLSDGATADQPTTADVPSTADHLSAKKFETKSVPFQDLGTKTPVSEIDSSLIVFASKSKPKPAKQTVSLYSSGSLFILKLIID